MARTRCCGVQVDPHVVEDTGMTKADVADMVKAWAGNMAAVQQYVEAVSRRETSQQHADASEPRLRQRLRQRFSDEASLPAG